MPQPKFAPGPRGCAYTEADDFNMQIEHVNNEFFLDKWAGGGWTNISVHKTYADALAARNEIMKFLRSGAAEDVVTATDSRERPATIKESLTVHDCFGWAWEDAGGQWVFVKNSPGQEHAIACHAAALKEIKIDQPQAQGELTEYDWSLLQATQDSLREHMSLIAQHRAALENIKYHAEFSGGGDDSAVLRGQLKCILDEIAAITHANQVLEGGGK